jgi:hypothetical protein
MERETDVSVPYADVAGIREPHVLNMVTVQNSQGRLASARIVGLPGAPDTGETHATSTNEPSSDDCVTHYLFNPSCIGFISNNL